VTAGLVERYLSLAGARHRAAIQSYTTLSLARHVQISHALEGGGT
jgi:hypothetical protein